MDQKKLMARQKLQLNLSSLFRVLLITGLLIGGPSFVLSQEPPPAAPVTEKAENQQEVHDTKDLEQLLKRYNTDPEKVINDNEKLQATDALQSEVNDAEIEKIRPPNSLGDAVGVYAKKKKKVETPVPGNSLSENIKIPLASLQKLSEEELLKLLKENTRESNFAPYIDQFPKITLYCVRLIKDKEAIPSAVKIVENKDKLIWFAGVMISTFLLGFLLERIMRKEGRSLIGSIGLYMLRVAIMTVVRFTILMYFYKTELTPAMKVIEKTFF